MPMPLDRRWQPDGGRMRSTTAWILQREPLLVRLAPLVALIVVVGLAIWVTQSEVVVYRDVPAEIGQYRSGESFDSVLVHFAGGDGDLVRPGSSIVLIAPRGSLPPVRLHATVWRAIETDVSGRTGAELIVPASLRAEVRPGFARVRVPLGSRSLASELLVTARGGRSKP